MDIFSNYSPGSGLLVTWDRLGLTSGVDHYRVMRGLSWDDPDYLEAGYVMFPQEWYVDPTASIDSYFRIQAEAADNTILATSPPIWGEELLLRASVAREMDPFLNLRVEDEEVQFLDDGRTMARVTAWRPMNYEPRPQLRISYAATDGNREARYLLPQSGVTDFTNLITRNDDGSLADPQPSQYPSLSWFNDATNVIHFVDASGNPTSIAWGDQVWASYSFPAFSHGDLNEAMWTALLDIIAQPGVNKNIAAARGGGRPSLGSVPVYFDPAIVFGASFYLTRRLLLSMNQRERRLAFIDSTGERDETISNLKEIMISYGEQFKELKETLRISRLPQIGIVVQEAYMLPGQRNRFFRMAFKGN